MRELVLLLELVLLWESLLVLLWESLLVLLWESPMVLVWESPMVLVLVLVSRRCLYSTPTFSQTLYRYRFYLHKLIFDSRLCMYFLGLLSVPKMKQPG